VCPASCRLSRKCLWHWLRYAMTNSTLAHRVISLNSYKTALGAADAAEHWTVHDRLDVNLEFPSIVCLTSHMRHLHAMIHKTADCSVYTAENQLSQTVDPLHCWQANEAKFCSLAVLARKYLAIPATSAPSECVFSLAGNICNRRRACLSPEHLNALVFLNANSDLLDK